MAQPDGTLETLHETLPLAQRLALSYAPAAARDPVLALFALDARLAGLIRHSSEPMLAQLRLAWWRETLRRDAGEWPEGEPLLAALRGWRGAHGELEVLVDGWEALTAPAPLPEAALRQLAEGRAAACAALAHAVGAARDAGAAGALGRAWAHSDLAMRLSRPDEREAARRLATREAPARPRVARALRPLAVLAALAQRRMRLGEESAAHSPAAMLLALRVGLLGS
ncbi:squalene/phytoene synthase family protein [Novosphingobium album (ex Liu et al. 2023)]|uniref:Phytoene synthase n=1 Tax=Novosphingobium album (ex Liu et al. 2023) TaxID=3031130 RepID=A0ABT5WVD1_9SPHN|nr:squalene/phytoene synthase family protein [Novosphingobium album (ex Liu et al. 2023)]MDE8653859.1 hypothetical protein [Novosphingobium album (ex Liu et al. 2023)]